MRNLHTRIARPPDRTSLDVYALIPGKSYRVSVPEGRGLPLVQDLEPDDRLAEISRFEWLPQGVVLRIMSRRDVRLGSFYRVRLRDGRIGYVNITALLGANIDEVKE